MNFICNIVTKLPDVKWKTCSTESLIRKPEVMWHVVRCLGVAGITELRKIYKIFNLLSDDVSYLKHRSRHRPKWCTGSNNYDMKEWIKTLRIPTLGTGWSEVVSFTIQNFFFLPYERAPNIQLAGTWIGLTDCLPLPGIELQSYSPQPVTENPDSSSCETI